MPPARLVSVQNNLHLRANIISTIQSAWGNSIWYSPSNPTQPRPCTATPSGVASASRATLSGTASCSATRPCSSIHQCPRATSAQSRSRTDAPSNGAADRRKPERGEASAALRHGVLRRDPIKYCTSSRRTTICARTATRNFAVPPDCVIGAIDGAKFVIKGRLVARQAGRQRWAT